jgi:hypothetical protein
VSYWTSVAITTRFNYGELLAALQSWAEERERAGAFSHVDDKTLASDAWVIVGHVNHLDHDSLRAAIRATVRDETWGYCEPVGVAFIDEEGGMWWQQLGEDGEWR